MRDEEGQTVRVEFVGAEHQPVVVVDNFFPRPERLIADAEALNFEVMGEFYPGIRARAPQSYFSEVEAVLARVLREFFGQRGPLASRALYSLVTTPSEQLTLAQRIPHIDGLQAGSLAVLHYLSHEDFGGTAFYRHRSSGFETVDASRHARYLDMLSADFAAHGEPAPAYIQGDTPIFEQIARRESVFNRALIYRSSLLHCGSVPNDVELPADVRTGRLTVASFLTAH